MGAAEATVEADPCYKRRKKKKVSANQPRKEKRNEERKHQPEVLACSPDERTTLPENGR
jgi:hypothetical protein